jgi:hypothetical protein
MTWRKCLVRGLVCSALGLLILGGALYALWTNPAAVRRLVQEQLAGRFARVSVQLGSAHLRLLGGIVVEGLRIARTDGLDRADFLYVPNAVIYHDKEHMLEGKVLIRKVELNRPQFRLVRDRDGKCNLAGILGPMSLGERLPTVVIRGGTILLEDHKYLTSPVLEIRNVQLTMINDPLTELKVEGGGDTDVLGPVRLTATVPRTTLAAEIHIDLAAVAVNDDLARRAAAVYPDAGYWLDQLTGQARVQAKLRLHEQSNHPVSYDVSVHFDHGRCAHPALPFPLDHIELDARCADGLVGQAKLSATSGKTRLTARLADGRVPHAREELENFHDLVGELDVRAEHIEANDSVARRLPDNLAFIKDDYSPSGPFSLSYTWRRAGAAPMRREWLVELEGVSGSYHDFPYPLHDVRGKVLVDTSASPLRNIAIDVSGRAGDSPFQVTGTIKGKRAQTAVQIDIHGTDVPLDQKILEALPERARGIAMKFLPQESRRIGLKDHPMGKADFHAAVFRKAGATRIDKRFTVSLKDSALEYDLFPYPLENVSGVLIIHPDHWECKNFRGAHSGGEFLVEGHSERFDGRAGELAPDGREGPKPEIVHIRITGRNILLDQELERALSPAPGAGKERKELQNTWRMLALGGRMNFTAEVVDHPNQPRDIDVTVGVQGCTMKPTFFDYALSNVSGTVRYAAGEVYLKNILARHGAARLGMTTGLIRLKPGGGFLAWLRGIKGQNILPDRELMSALPEGLRKGLRPLQFHQPLDVNTGLTIDAPPGINTPFKVWWDGGVTLNHTTFHTGVKVEDATGQFSCRGHHDGRQVRGVFGDLVLSKAILLGQPLADIHARLEVQPDSPEVVRLRDIKASLFGGTIGGEARLEFDSKLHYDVLLEGIGIQLEQFGRHNLGSSADKAQLEGPVEAALHLQGVGGNVIELAGNGRLDVPRGKMGELPVLLDLVKAFGLRVPDRTAFEQASMIFAIEGPRLRVQQLDLFGAAVSLRGQGTVDLDGDNLDVDFTATPGLLIKVLPAGIDAIPPWISQQILKIKMAGKLGKGGGIRFDKELAPGVLDPLRRVIGGE